MRLFTIAPEQEFLTVLARAIIDGFPFEGEGDRPSLSRWTVLVPTRRAARSLQQILVTELGSKTLVLPRIRPFGDVDEDELFSTLPEAGVDDAISSAGQLNVLLALVKDWSAAHPEEAVARDMISAPERQLQMAVSLQELVNQMETEEADLASLRATHDLELAFHRSAVISLFDMLATDYPARLQAEQVLGPSARRNRLIRLQAEQLANSPLSFPMIAAGSTGSNPATRRLLQVIATRPNGAVVFPGFDVTLDATHVGPEHPHHAMVTTLQQWTVAFSTVRPLGPTPSTKSQMAWQALRPAEVEAVAVNHQHDGLTLIQAKDQTEEADVIALRLRQHAVEGQGEAALITPDRALAARVQAALSRWHIKADDSAGARLSTLGMGSLLLLLLEARRKGYDATSVLSVLHHPACCLGYRNDEARALAARLEIACVRGKPFGVSLSDLARLATQAQADAAGHRHAPLILQRVTAPEWQALQGYVTRLAAILPVADAIAPISTHIDWMMTTLDALSPPTDTHDSSRLPLMQLLEGLKADGRFASEMGFDDAALLVAHHLRRATVRAPRIAGNRIHILGLLEARLVPLSLAILGGLNEGHWPAIPDTGPWLNRAMRKAVGLAMPERDIGLTAHDFVQSLCRPNVMLTWSERVGGKPVLPSRLVLRLRSTLPVALDTQLVTLARSLDQPHGFTPHRKPHARPPVVARPRRFSVTEVEKLVRDSYHIHAKRILQLTPLQDAESEPDHALRGSLIHAALAAWAHDPFTDDANTNVQRLLQRGRESFAPYMHLPEVARFWWVRFERMAKALVEIEHSWRADIFGLKTEINGAHVFHVNGIEHTLTARADRIDILRDGTLRLIDYKSGGVPSAMEVKTGFAPQLPLEAMIATRGGFRDLLAARVAAAYYVKVSGGAREPAKLEQRPDKSTDIDTVAADQFENFQRLLQIYLTPSAAYLPRHNLQLDDKATDYDHLSRRREWQLAGDGS